MGNENYCLLQDKGTMAVLAISMAGAAIGWGIGGTFLGMSSASLGWMAGSFVGNALFGPSGPDVNQEGPRLGDLKVQVSTYGHPIATSWGSTRFAGNCIWSTPIVETTHTSSQSSGGKGGGGSTVTTTSYSYSQSFAVALCTGPIAGVRRIWANGKIIYNLANEASLATVEASKTIAKGIRVYSGTTSQMPDSLIQANVGVANTPAYRGIAYVVFENLQLADYGNRMPSLEFEVVKETTEGLTLVGAMTGRSGSVYVSAEQVAGRYFFRGGYTAMTVQIFDMLDPAAPVRLTDIISQANIQGILVKGSILYVTGPRAASPYGYILETWDVSDPANPRNTSVVAIGFQSTSMFIRGKYLYVFLLVLWGIYIFDITNPSIPVFSSSIATTISGTAIDGEDGDLFYALERDGLTGVFEVWETSDNSHPTRVMRLAPGIQLMGLTARNGYLYITDAGNSSLYVYDIKTAPSVPALVRTVSLSSPPRRVTASTAGDMLYIATAGAHFFVYSLTDPSNPTFLTSYGSTDATGWIQEQSGYVYAEATTAQGVIYAPKNTVGAAVSDICLGTTLLSSDIDVTALTDALPGYFVQKSSARSQIEQLMKAFFFDAVESSGKIKFVKRGSSAALTIPEDDLAARLDGAPVPDNLITNMQQELELPLSVDLQFLDKTNAYQIGNQTSRRRKAVATVNKVSYNLAISMTPNKGKQVADVLLYDAWTGRLTYEIAASRKYCFLEPTDTINFVKGTRTYFARITEESRDGGVTTYTLVQDAIDVYTQSAPAATSVAPSDGVALVPQTSLVLLDIPILRDADSGVGFYAAARGYTADGWKGAQPYKSSDNGGTWDALGRSVLNVAAMGVASNALGNFSGKNVFDELNSVTVSMYSEQLSSITALAVLNGGNVALLGNEIIQFRDATLVSPKTYRLTGLLRGRQGTEQHMSTHTSTDAFILLSATTTYLYDAPSSEYNLSRLYKAASLGGWLSDAAQFAFTNTAAGLKPYSAVLLGGGRDASLNATLTWTRRTRIQGAWLDNVDAPLGEASEAYEVEIYSNSSYTTIKRTITGLTTPTTTYTAAQQTTDFGSAQSTIYFKVFQVSATVGRGFEARGVM